MVLPGWVIQQRTNCSGLGRWAWLLFRGRNGLRTRIYVAYRPTRSSGNGTVYQQHRRYLRTKSREDCPRDAFLEDLRQELQGRKQAGERIVLMMDANGPVCNGPIKQMFDDLLMREMLTTKHVSGRPPATYVRGSTIIDGIWCTPDIPTDKATWLAHDRSPGNHTSLLVDVPWQSLLGEDVLRVVRPDARRLNSQLPRVKAKYDQELERQLRIHRIKARLYLVQELRPANGPLTELLQDEMEAIDRVTRDSMICAEKRCRKLRMREVDFSPEVNLAGLQALLWKQVYRKKIGERVQSRWIQKLAKQCKVSCPMSVTVQEALQNWKEHSKTYRAKAPNAPTLRRNWMDDRRLDPTTDEETRK